MRLTDTAIRKLHPKVTPYKISDGHGLHLLVQPNGSRLWRMAYRFAGKQRVLAFGAYPVVSLAMARRRRDEAKELLDAGSDPGAERRERKLAASRAAADTFEAVALEWLEGRRKGLTPDHFRRIEARLRDNVFPELGGLGISTIEPPRLLDAVRKIERRGAHEVARKTLQTCSQVFRYAVGAGRAARDPSADLRGVLKAAPPRQHRAALKAADLPAFFGALSTYDGAEQTQLAVRFILLTFVRTDELRFGEWTEIVDLEGRQPLWRIPAARMKMSREHLVPLSRQAVETALALRRLAGGSRMMLPAPGRHGVISENTMLFALYRMGYHSRATVHGFRGTASTILNESGHFHPDWIELQLAHVAGGVRGAYNSALYLAQRRQMMQWWADYLSEQEDLGRLIG